MWKGTTSAANLMHLVGIAGIISLACADAKPGNNVFNDAQTLNVSRYSNSTLFDEEFVGPKGSDLSALDKRKLQHVMRRRYRTKKKGYTRGGKSGKSSKSSKGLKRGNNVYNNRPNGQPKKSNNIYNSRPNGQPSRPSQQSARPKSSTCFSVQTYDAIDRDIANIKNNIRDDKSRSHFLGGIVRLAAHDFMDFDGRSSPSMGPDGCYDPNHSNNKGLETIWCNRCALKVLYDEKYSHLSRADFWIASANAVIRLTSIDNKLDLKSEFMWGRRDRDMCRGSGDRLPEPSGCSEVEDVLLDKMGLGWKDAVALLGGHTLGRGEREFSGHEGTWASSDKQAQIFDKSYYEALYTNTWFPRNMGRSGEKQDWTTGGGHQMMLNTDMCLVFDIDQNVQRSMPCCTRPNAQYANGQNQCLDREAAQRRCPMYTSRNRRREATDAVRQMLGGSITSRNNAPFYIAFAKAWRKATTVGQNDLYRLAESC